MKPPTGAIPAVKVAQAESTVTATSRMPDLGSAMVEAAWAAAEGQRGAGLQALGDYLQAVGIDKDTAGNILQSLTTTISQAQAKAAMRAQNSAPKA